MWRKLCSLLCVLDLLTSCAGLPKAPAYPSKEDGFSGPGALQRPGLRGDRPPPLTLQPGDVLTIDVVSEQPKTWTAVSIDATGRVHLPMVGDVDVGGGSLSEAERKVQAALRKLDRFVEVTIQLSDAKGQRATVLGAVTTQGSIQLVPGARLADLIAGAGGPLRSAAIGTAPESVADLDGAVMMRDGKPLPISVTKALEGDPLHNVYVHPGDHLYVPPALGATVSVLGQVGAPHVFPHHAGLRLTQALAIAGGVTVGGDKSDIRVIRGKLDAPRVYRASLRAVFNGSSHDVLLLPGDIIFVTDHPIEDLGEVVSLIAPILSLGLTGTLLAVTLNRTTTTTATGH
jgi:polysaccharide biosynthesis/export protein